MSTCDPCDRADARWSLAWTFFAFTHRQEKAENGAPRTPLYTSPIMDLATLVRELRAECDQMEAKIKQLQELTDDGSVLPRADGSREAFSIKEGWEIYDRLRSYIDNQANWINARLTWLLTIQGFLFASYTIALQTIAGIAMAPLGNPGAILNWLRFFDGWLLPILGLVVCLCALAGAVAGMCSINSTHTKWEHELRDKIPAEVRSLAPMRGGFPVRGTRRRVSHHWVHLLGSVAPVGIPVLISAAWVALFIYFTYYRRHP